MTPSDDRHHSLCCCFILIFVVLCHSCRFCLRPSEQCLTLVATPRVKEVGHKQMAGRWCPSGNHWKYLLRYGLSSCLPLTHSIVPRFPVRTLDTQITPGFSLLIQKRMFAVNLIVIVESLRSIATHKADDIDHFFIPAVASVAAALGWLSTYSVLKTED